MGYTSQEFKSASLTNLYPAYYTELQVINWSHVDIVLTKSNGEQTTMLRSDTPMREEDACVVIERRSCNGMRISPDSSLSARDSRGIELPAKRINIPFDAFRNSPIRIEEFNWIISTVEQAMIAKNMACDINYGSLLQETRVDLDTVDPRLVFQVIDPRNEFEMLLVNIFGQTIILRAGKFDQLIPSSVQPVGTPESGRLICYLKYPMEYFSGAKAKQVVFEIPLEEIYRKEPFQIPSGDYVCIATTMADLQEVVAKKTSCARGIVTSGSISEKMVPREVYDEAEKSYKAKIEQLKEDSRQRLETLTIQKNNEIAALKSSNAEKDREISALKAKCSEWEKISEARTTAEEHQQRVDKSAEQARKEAVDAERKDIDNMWTTLKIGGTILSAVTSFALTMMVKASSKK